MNPSSLSIAVASAIKKRRNELGLSQDKFAYMCGLDRTYISSIECGKRNLTLTTLDRIISNLSLSYDGFFKIVTGIISNEDR